MKTPRRPRQRPRKEYERRVDLTPYQRLLRFIRWMRPNLSIEDLLRMLPEADAWSRREWARQARLLVQALAGEQTVAGERTRTLAELVPYVVIGWGQTSGRWERDLLKDRRYANEPVWLRKRPPTITGLCRLADDLRRVLDRLLQEGEWAVGDIADEIDGRIVKTFHPVGVGGRAGHSRFMEVIQDNDFRVYCFALLARLLDEGHGWRLTRCDQCRGFFLKTRRDPPERPSRFCSEPCRRGWHNPRRPRKGGQA
jgi:hypothetical protein